MDIQHTLFGFFADAVLVLHFCIVVFVVGGLVVVAVGNALGWRWVNRLWFRALHLAAIGIVAAESWLGIVCPLTTLEAWLRAQTGQDSYAGSFIEHWLQQALFFQAPTWVFTLAYTVFGALVVLVWWRFPPVRNASNKRGSVAQ